ncbi:MAG TPA: hypothetical protein VGX71_17235 [Pseudaminobacter sp.]|nr:hypothetical protein [Pseudaminobacter sp.]
MSAKAVPARPAHSKRLIALKNLHGAQMAGCNEADMSSTSVRFWTRIACTSCLSEKRGPSARSRSANTVRTRATPPHDIASCIDAKRLGVELAARQNIIDETFKLDPGGENGARF